jgi:K+-transporting ATPase ATPase A chain
MTLIGLTQVLLYFVVLLGLSKPLGWYMARVYEGSPCGLDRIFSPMECLIYRLCRINPAEDMTWKTYAVGMLLFNAAGMFGRTRSRFQHGCELREQY